MTINLSQSLQFKIRKLELVSKFGTINLTEASQEINIYDSIFMPCIRGELLIQDAVGLANRILLDGSEFLNIVVSKDDEDTDTLYEKIFRIYKISNRKTVTPTSEAYLLHFISEEMILSSQQKIRQAFDGLTHSDMAVIIMVNYLKMNGSKFGLIEPTKGLHSLIIPNLTPFDALNWLTKRSLNEENLPNFLFFENKKGYCFTSLSKLISEPKIFDINFEQKNISATKDSNFLGARDMRVVSQFDVLQNIENGVYSGKFIGFDTITRQVRINNMDYSKTYSQTKHHLNRYPNFSNLKNKEGLDLSQMYDSKVSLYPFESLRRAMPYVRNNDKETANITDNTHFYVFQRKPILTNLLQTVVHLTLPGNFALSSGYNVYLKVPVRGTKVDKEAKIDDTLDGKYIITATHQVIRKDRHETIIEVATDSTNKPFVVS
jgi:hypothetical protein